MSNIIRKNIHALVYSKLLKALLTFGELAQLAICKIFSRLDVSADPTEIVVRVNELFEARMYVADSLQKIQEIKLSPREFLSVVEALVKLDVF